MNVDELIEAQDMNGLLRVVDSYCEGRRWDALLDLADRCEDAVERGKQLWPIAAHIEFRIALEAPADYAAGAIESALGRFTLGPLTEVAASTHTWSDLAPYIETPHTAAYVAQERVLRGEDLRADPRAHPEVLELPLLVLDWEPTYTVATYRSNVVEVPEPWDPRSPMVETTGSAAEALGEPEIVSTLLDLVQPWTSESNGAARAVVVEGEARAAVSELTFGSFLMGPLEPSEALQRMAWAAASGGAHGRRRGAALGRFMAWQVAALLTDSPWPPEADELVGRLNELRWYRWDEPAMQEGWILRVAVEDPQHGWSAALGASDLLEEGDER